MKEAEQIEITNPPTSVNFIKNSFWSFVTVLLAKIGGMVFVIFIARFLLPEKFGVYNLALSITLLLISLTNIATNQALSKYLSYSINKKNFNQASSYFQFIYRLKIFFSVIMIVTLILMAYPLSVYIFQKPELFLPLILFSLYILTFSLQNLFETVFYVFGKVNFLSIKEVLVQSSKIIFCFLVFYFFYISLHIAILGLIISSLIAIFFLRSYLMKNKIFLFSKTKGKIDKKGIKKFIKNAIFSTFSLTIFNYIDVILLGIFVTSTYIGYYSSAFLIVGGFFGLISFSNITLPLFTKLKGKKLEETFSLISRYLSVISIPLIFGIFILGRYILLFIYGYEYLEATIPLTILSLLIFETPITDNFKSLILSKGRPEIITKIMVQTTFVNLMLNFLLIYFLSKISLLYAIIGASIAIVISRFIVMFCLLQIIKKDIGISWNIHGIIKPLFSSIIMVIPLLIINSKISDMNYLIGFLEIILGVIIYFSVMLLIKGIKKEDIFLIKKIFPIRKS